MAREVTHEETGPKPIDEEELDAQGGTAYVCQCGLSDDRPFCDGSHSETADEKEEAVYKYENDGTRKEIEEVRYADD